MGAWFSVLWPIAHDGSVIGTGRWAWQSVGCFDLFRQIAIRSLLVGLKTLLALRSFAELVEDSLSACIGVLHSGCGFAVALDMPTIGTTVGEAVFMKIRQIYAESSWRLSSPGFGCWGFSRWLVKPYLGSRGLASGPWSGLYLGQFVAGPPVWGRSPAY